VTFCNPANCNSHIGHSRATGSFIHLAKIEAMPTRTRRPIRSSKAWGQNVLATRRASRISSATAVWGIILRLAQGWGHLKRRNLQELKRDSPLIRSSRFAFRFNRKQ
jgi:hypothetical protein